MNTIATTVATDKIERVSLVDRWARSLFLRILNNIEYGQLVIDDAGGQFCFGTDSRLSAHIRVLDPRFYRRVLLGGSIGAGEAYVENLWKTDDLARVIRVMARNLPLMNRVEKRFGWLLHPYRLLMHRCNRNDRRGAKRNILNHYDIGNDLYASFLDSKMMYSSALYPDRESDLDRAATHKLDVICQKLDLKPDDHVVEIGSGWCGFAIHAAANYGCRVTTTTISDAQYEEGKRRIEAAGLGDRITLLQKDYRDLDGAYDKLVSIEMIEAVGHQFLPAYFTACSRLLKQNGIMLLQAITMNDQGYNDYVKGVDFIQRHIFPGGCLVSNKTMFDLFAARTDMVVRGLEDFGSHYARTLRDWRNRFNDALDSGSLSGYDERFRRLWNFYLAYCEGGFSERTISVVHLVATKPGRDMTE